MFKTELTIEEEILLMQLLDGKKVDRAGMLYIINSTVSISDSNEGKEVAKSLFNKIKETSDYEFNGYRDILLESEY